MGVTLLGDIWVRFSVTWVSPFPQGINAVCVMHARTRRKKTLAARR